MRVAETSIQTQYRPAWSYASSAVSWFQKIEHDGTPPNHFGSESCFLSFLFSCLSLEAIIAEFLSDHCESCEDLMHPGISVLQRWKTGMDRLSIDSEESIRATAELQTLCNDTRPYGLLVRSRNKLVHPKAYTEVMDDQGHRILDGSIERLVSDLKSAQLGLPESQPAFPHIIKCRQGSEWAVKLMKEMILLIHMAGGVEVKNQWKTVLDSVPD